MRQTHPKALRFGPRAKEFDLHVFASVYESLQNAANQTPLVIMLWGPRLRSREWSLKRQEIRNALEQLGHTAFFSEQLGVPVAAVLKKGVEFLQSEAADIIVAIQSQYTAVGGVNHFVEFRVADAKMLLFMDEAAPDDSLYAHARAELQKKYNNIDTYNAQEDTARNELLKKIIDKVSVMQMVKYRALQNATRWGLRTDDFALSTGRLKGNVQPFRYNLLELYREHRNEIDVLIDPSAMFILALVNYLDKVSPNDLAREVSLPQMSLSQKLDLLRRAGMITQTQEKFETTGYGHHFLNGLGFPSSVTAPTISKRLAAPPLIQWNRVSKMAVGTGIALASVVLLFAAALYGANISQTQQPLELTPVRIVTAAKPFTPTHTAVPSRSPNATVTPVAR